MDVGMGKRGRKCHLAILISLVFVDNAGQVPGLFSLVRQPWPLDPWLVEQCLA